MRFKRCPEIDSIFWAFYAVGGELSWTRALICYQGLQDLVSTQAAGGRRPAAASGGRRRPPRPRPWTAAAAAGSCCWGMPVRLSAGGSSGPWPGWPCSCPRGWWNYEMKLILCKSMLILQILCQMFAIVAIFMQFTCPICQKYGWNLRNMQKICTKCKKYAQNMQKNKDPVCQKGKKNAKNMDNMQKICKKYAKNVQKICSLCRYIVCIFMQNTHWGVC